ncbi:hypothetical protein [Bhargavaea ginsengi]|uniref:hypothetical protein n=1 Tax=Bhargavaea ginsengi TaxID=426757 RepID=UPI003C73D405
MTTKSHCSNVWIWLAGVLAGVVLLALFVAVPFLLGRVAGFWEILLIIVVILVVLLALAVVLKALFSLLRKIGLLT